MISSEDDLKYYLSDNYKNLIKISSEMTTLNDTFTDIKFKLDNINKNIINLNKENLQTFSSLKRNDSGHNSSDEETTIESEMDAYFEKQKKRRTAEMTAAEASERLMLLTKSK